MTGQPLGHAVVHCHDHWDTLSARWASGLTDPDTRTLSIDIPPSGPGQESDLAAHIAIALGHPKPHHAPRRGSARARTVGQLLPNLIGYAATDLVLHRAHWLPAQTLELLLRVAAGTDTRVWLITTPPITRPETALVIGAWVHPDDTLTWPELRQMWDERQTPPPPPPAAPAPERTGFPAVPDSHFTSFRSRAGGMLDAQQMVAVNAELDNAIGRAEQFAHELSATWHDHEAQGREEALATHLLVHVLDQHHSDPAVATCRLRGTQVGLLRHRWHLDADLASYLDGHTVMDSQTSELAQEPARSLQSLLATLDHTETSAAVLCLLGIPAAHTWRVSIDDIAPDGSTLTWHGAELAVPVAAQRHLAAARTARLHEGAPATEPLHRWSHTPPFSRHIREATFTELALYGANTTWQIALDVTNASAGLERLGITISRLPATPTDVRSGRAPHTRNSKFNYLASGRIVADPRHTRRLTYAEATVLAALLRRRQSPEGTTGAVVARARAHLRTGRLLSADSQLSPVAVKSLGS